MIDFFTVHEWIMLGIVGVLTGVGAVVKATSTEIGQRLANKIKKKLHHALRVDTVCPGDEALIAIVQMAKSVDEILAQFKPNGGGSMKDAMSRMANDLKTLVIESRHQTEAQNIAYDAAGLMIMRADAAGRVTWVSKSMREKFGAVYEGAFLGWSWLNHVHHDDRDRTRERWEQAVTDKCELQDEYRVMLPGGLVANVLDSSKPVWSDNECVGWYCVVRIVSYSKPEAVNACA